MLSSFSIILGPSKSREEYAGSSSAFGGFWVLVELIERGSEYAGGSRRVWGSALGAVEIWQNGPWNNIGSQ